MVKRILAIAFIAIFLMSSFSYAADEGTAAKKPGFWQKLFSYPANVTKESVKVAADTGAKSADMVVKELKTGSDVSTGDVKKSGELVTEPVKDTVNTTAETVKGTVNIPMKAAQDSAADETAAVK